MVVKLKVGVISVQGAISEHVDALTSAASELGITNFQVIHVRKQEELEAVSALVIPGGESTTISKLLVEFNLYTRIIHRVNEEQLPILGTCAGCIVLATKGDIEIEKTDTKLLKLMDISVLRNAFGRQRESFEGDIDINLNGFEEPYHAVFIRAPVVESVWGKAKICAKLEGKIVLVKQDNLIAAAFHPELTSDLRLHKYFLELI